MSGDASSAAGARKRDFEVDGELYPFADRWLPLDEPARPVRARVPERSGRPEPGSTDSGSGAPGSTASSAHLHYVDEGSGRPVLMLHGNPTWSFLFRDVIARLGDDFRCVAPDYPGFGFSDHPKGYGYTPREHAERVGRLVDALGLEGLLMVGHDWGGPVGVAVASARPERVAGFVLCNTWCWPPDLRMRAFSWLMGGRHARWLHRRLNLFARWLVPLGIHRAERRTSPVLEAYRAPFPTPESREGTWVFPRAIRSASPWLEDLERGLRSLRRRPAELVWGRRDPALGRGAYPERWKAKLPGARLEWVEDASHYLPEDRPERLAAAVRRLARRAEP